jgi:polysaccharide pyruvyl transferase CsaB
VLGQGIGPLRRGISRLAVARVLDRVDAVTVRDAQSAELLQQIGVRRPAVTVTADPTFALSPCSQEEAVGLLAQAGIGADEDVVAVSLRRWPETPEVEAAAVRALRELAGRIPAKLLLVAMQSPDDEELARRVGEKIGAAQPERWSPQQLLGVLSRCRLVVGMRLHALIFAASVGVPSVGISYDPKVASFLDATGLEGVTLDELVAGRLPERAMLAWDNRESLAQRLPNVASAMRAAAEQNIRTAVELLDLR